ncbi:unnamed protein product [Rotaria sordida]|uniref:BHLH domain-containing protein n=1 Tax=Rotaria sordida TaxID=392033 RepID=A0A814NHS2_9BILA|nr:unnamed protein product [Rotaria sordida]CAF1091609.1 unnamed protein product [Rotaria sordida]CAF3523545.1 unnamed protein product [Rotaria sordida]CAF3640379.1 unnamed protein product [Rotaria sordida]
MNSSIDDKIIYQNTIDNNSSNINPPTKSRRGRKRITDPILATELKYHRRSRANDRERTRMRSLNEALEHLRTLLPIDTSSYYTSNNSTNHVPIVEDKLTKIETLRTASAYIRLLTDLLADDNKSSPTSNSYSYNMSNQQQQQVYQHSSYFSYAPSYSYYNPYC